MTTAWWALLLAAAVLWPARLAGLLDGAPLDTAADALVIGLALPALVVFDRRLLRLWAVRGLILLLLTWKAASAGLLAQDGWCLRFISPEPLFVDDLRVPHAWDVRADWRNAVPRCSAVMTRGFAATNEFPVWFFNLPPATWLQPALERERPPHVTLDLELHGSLHVSEAGSFRLLAGHDVAVTADIDGQPVSAAVLAGGVMLQPGTHDVAVRGRLTGDRWALLPFIDDEPLWAAATATITPPHAVDLWLRPVGRWLPPLAIAGILLIAMWRAASRLGDRTALALAAAMPAVAVAAAATGRGVVARAVPLLFAAGAWLRLPRRLQNLHGAQWLIGVPFLALIAARGFSEIGRTTWYTSGDDWWLFQRFAYRIYLQGFWLEGGEPAFWFQPFYRWIAGALHLVFGDSSVGELFWDGACALAGALFAFHVTRVMAGFRWGMAAGALTLLVMTLGPGWYLFGRGLSELSSSGLIYAAALLMLRGRGAGRFVVLAGLCAMLAFYTRLNNLPMVLALALFSLPLTVPAGHWPSWRRWWPRCAKPALAGLAGAVVLGVILFGLRTYYYTGSVNALAGTQASARSVWQPTGTGESVAENVIGSFLMVVTMSDPARLEPRAVPIVAGLAAALLGLLGAGRFRALPLNVCVLCLAGVAGAFVARGSAYPGRFSMHLVPAAVALAVCGVRLWVGQPRARHDQVRRDAA